MVQPNSKVTIIIISLQICLHAFFLFFSSFKLFLELEPQLRDIIHKFYESNYASCLKLLEEIKVKQYKGYSRNVNSGQYEEKG